MKNILKFAKSNPRLAQILNINPIYIWGVWGSQYAPGLGK